MIAAEGAASPTPHLPFDDFVRARCQWCANMLGLRWPDHKDVEDAVQEAMVLAGQDWDRVGTMDNPEAWVLKVAHRLLSRWASDDQRHDRIVRHNERCLIAESAPDPSEQLSDRAQLKQLLQLIPINHAVAIILHEVIGYSVKDTADILVIPENTAKTHLSRGRSKLKELLEASEPVSIQAGGRP